MPSVNPVEKSFELASERCEDLTPLVFLRLHAEHPETLALFRTEGSDLVKGSMLALAIEAILDFVGERSGKYRLIVSEVHSHDDYGTSRDLFAGFFAVIMRTLQDVLGPDWTSEMDRAWRDLLREIDSVVTAA